MPDIVRDLRSLLDRMTDLPRLLTKSEYNTVCSDFDRFLTAGGRLASYLRVSREFGGHQPGREIAKRYRDSEGMPVIPGLDGAAYAFDHLWIEAQKWAFDDACSKCETLFALGREHPALAPEMRLLSELVMLHNEFCSRLDFLPPKLTAAEKRFFGFIEAARSLTLKQACMAFQEIADATPATPRAEIMGKLLRRLVVVVDGLRMNEVSERLSRM